ncbi:MAG TPA: hypothetical protein VGS18_04515 [Thermoplasmata archaeon]|nr:hypothetical protein [Thermoplasmata archaeon]
MIRWVWQLLTEGLTLPCWLVGHDPERIAGSLYVTCSRCDAIAHLGRRIDTAPDNGRSTNGGR